MLLEAFTRPLVSSVLISDLLSSAAYPHAADDVTLLQTRISYVRLAGAYAYKFKKPLDLESSIKRHSTAGGRCTRRRCA